MYCSEDINKVEPKDPREQMCCAQASAKQAEVDRLTNTLTDTLNRVAMKVAEQLSVGEKFPIASPDGGVMLAAKYYRYIFMSRKIEFDYGWNP